MRNQIGGLRQPASFRNRGVIILSHSGRGIQTQPCCHTPSPRSKDAQGRAYKYSRVEQHAGVANVLKVEVQLATDALQICVRREIYLRQSSHSGRHAQTIRIAGNLLLQKLRNVLPLRPRSYERHLATSDVEELRQVIQMQPAEPTAKRCNFRGSIPVGIRSALLRLDTTP